MKPANTQNIVLIGLPGSGKSSLGQRLAKRLRRPLYDTDTLVQNRAGKPIPRIFAEDGEPAFRELEAACIRDSAAGKGRIIVTGGGAVLNEENMKILAEDGILFFIDRHPAHILRSTHLEDRPLVHGEGARLFALYKERLPLYRHYAHCRIANTGRLRRAELLITKKYIKIGRTVCNSSF